MTEHDYGPMSRPIHQFLRAFFVLSLSGLACGLFSSGIPADNQTGPNGAALFQDDFGEPNSGWSVQQSQGLALEYADGEFRIFVDNQAQPNAYPITFIERSFADVRLEVDTRQISGVNAAKAGLVCRRANATHYVLGDIDATGIARIGVFGDDLLNILGYEEGATGLQAGKNHLRLDCVGNVATLYVNGKQVVTAELEDASSQGSIGFAAGRAAEGQTEFRFSHFAVYER